jgi:hypothetical protein
VLAFAAEHRLIMAAHVQTLLGVSGAAASRRLRALTRAGYLRFKRELAGPGCYLIDRGGLRAIASDLPRPRDLDLATYKHDVGLAWLWLAARTGAFGAVDNVISERRMRSHDGRRLVEREPLGVRLGGTGPHGRERRHYPDLLLVTGAGRCVAVELELTAKPRSRWQTILGGYAADPRIDAALYLVEHERIGRGIAAAAAAAGIPQMVHVRRVSFGPAAAAPERTPERHSVREGSVRPQLVR